MDDESAMMEHLRSSVADDLDLIRGTTGTLREPEDPVADALARFLATCSGTLRAPEDDA